MCFNVEVVSAAAILLKISLKTYFFVVRFKNAAKFTLSFVENKIGTYGRHPILFKFSDNLPAVIRSVIDHMVDHIGYCICKLIANGINIGYAF